MAETGWDLLVVGGGPGGYTAAIYGAKKGLTTALVEKDALGGNCLHRGCIPTKALVETSRLYTSFSDAAAHGIEVEVRGLDWSLALERKDRIVDRLYRGVEFLLKKNKVTILRGQGRVTAPNRVEVDGPDGGTYQARHVILATGSRPVDLPGLEADGVSVLNSNHALGLSKIPRSLVVVGGGVIGCEFASIFAPLGTKVTVVELLDTLLPGADSMVVKEIGRALRKKKVKVHTGERVASLKGRAGELELTLASGTTLQAEKVLVAVGRTPAIDGAVDEAWDVLSPQGEVMVDESCRTRVEGLWAIGDVTGGVMLAHWASHMAIVAVDNITGGCRKIDPTAIPSCVFTTPEAAWVGLTQAQAREKGIVLRTGSFPFRALGRAQTGGAVDGTVEILAEEGSGRVVGFHAVGPHVTDLLAEATLAIRMGLTFEDLEGTIHAHPTYPEALHEAAADVAGMAVHI
jgi:dihydrolipoamide dehydrogenase